MTTREQAYDDEINPLMAQIIAICKRERIPMLATFQYTEPDEKPGFCTTSLPGEDKSLALLRLRTAWDRERRGGAVALAETIVTNPDGSKSISIRRVT